MGSHSHVDVSVRRCSWLIPITASTVSPANSGSGKDNTRIGKGKEM